MGKEYCFSDRRHRQTYLYFLAPAVDVVNREDAKVVNVVVIEELRGCAIPVDLAIFANQ